MIKNMTYIHDGQEKTIEFGQKNFLIGPKGGGKTTLLKTMWNISHLRQPSKENKAALFNSKWNVNIENIIIDGEKVTIDSLANGSDFKNDDSSDFQDIILQNDSLKVSIDSSKKFSSVKEKLIDVAIDQFASDFTPQIEKMCECIEDINKYKNLLNQNPSFLKGIGSKNKTSVINKFSELINPSTNVISKELNNISQYKMLLEQTARNTQAFKETDLYIKNHIDGNINKELDDLQKSILKMINKLSSEHSKLNRINVNVLEKIDTKSKNLISDKRANASDDDKKQIDRDNFINNTIKLLSKINEFKNYFNKFMDQENIKCSLEIPVDGYTDYFFKIDKSIEIDHDIMGDILNKFLYAPTNRSEYVKWIEKAVAKDGLRSQPLEAKVKKAITSVFGSKIVDNTHLYINGRNYNSLSLGQRSITMLLNKMDTNTDNYFFVDQPEDNLDNKTIYEEIVKDRLNNNESDVSKKQMFIVTHNANIGMLGFDPTKDKIIYANLLEEGYKETSIDGLKQSAVSILEGGNIPLSERYNKIKGVS